MSSDSDASVADEYYTQDELELYQYIEDVAIAAQTFEEMLDDAEQGIYTVPVNTYVKGQEVLIKAIKKTRFRTHLLYLQNVARGLLQEIEHKK